MTSDPLGNLWGEYQRQLESQKVVPGEGYIEWIKRNPRATHKEFDKAYPGSLTPEGYKELQNPLPGGGMPRFRGPMPQQPFQPMQQPPGFNPGFPPMQQGPNMFGPPGPPGQPGGKIDRRPRPPGHPATQPPPGWPGDTPPPVPQSRTRNDSFELLDNLTNQESVPRYR